LTVKILDESWQIFSLFLSQKQ